MATTATGTPFTTYSAAVAGAGTVRWAVADSKASVANLPTIVYCHGAGGGSNQFETLSAWSGLRDWLIDNGWVWIEGTGGGAQPWGNPASQTAYELSFAHVDGLLDLGAVVVLGRSMGGAVGARLYLAGAFASRCVGVIENSGVQDLVWAYDADSGRWTDAFNAAWGVSSRAEFVSAVTGLNPIDGPASAWTGKKVLQLVGDADTTVPPSTNAYPMRTLYAGRPSLDRLDVRAGGDHSASNGSYLQMLAMTDFLTIVTGGTPPPPVVYVAQETFYVLGGKFYPMVPAV